MKGLRSVAISAVVALLIYLTVISGLDAEAVANAMARLGWYWWSVILALSLVNYGLRFARWHYYLGFLGYELPIARHLLIYIAGFAMTTTPGKAGEAVRSVYLRPAGVTYGDSLAALFSERFSDLMAILLLAALGLLAFSDYAGLLVAAVIVVACVLIVIQRPELVRYLQRRAQRQPPGWTGALARLLIDPLTASSSLLRSRPLYIGLVLGLIGWGAEGVALFYIAQVLGIDVDLTTAISIYAISVLVGAISFLPGGLGSTEAAMVVLLTVNDAGAAIALACTLITRVATLWFAVLLGAVALLVLEFTQGQHHPEGNRF